MPDPVSIDPIANGPLKVSGAVDLVNSSGEPVATEAPYWLCRSGGSANKPFCDGTHKKIGVSSARQSDPASLRAPPNRRHRCGRRTRVNSNRRRQPPLAPRRGHLVTPGPPA